jgi:type I restriction enzyme R subunit
MANEATARLHINQFLTNAGWLLLPTAEAPANVHVEAPNTVGFADYLLFDRRGFPLAVVEAKASHIQPLSAKDQARGYAVDQHARFVFLSNGAESYQWDLAGGSPVKIDRWPSPGELEALANPEVRRRSLTDEPVGDDYIARTQNPRYDQDAGWLNPATRADFVLQARLRFLRPYQVDALKAIQAAVARGQTRFLLEMATGTGKTLTSAALIKLFLRTGSAHRILFLVDRLELEDQAYRAFVAALAKDAVSVVYKENKDDWRKAQIVVTTVQSLMAGDRYKTEFRPADFGLVISDEAHRSISGQARDVFEYFRGYKLGLTATPRDLLRGIWATTTPTSEYELEVRSFHDTYRIFGCESGEPTFRYSLLDGVKDGYLVNPTVIDCRTEKTTQLLSEQGLTFTVTEDGTETEQTFGRRDFEKSYFSPQTNLALVRTFLDHALNDPVSHETGKSLVFCVSQNHAAKITQLLNEEAHRRWAGRYASDFARQVTSSVTEAQAMTVRFSENTLGGKTAALIDYDSSRTRVCVTVAMMTTGYDCEDLLNVVLMRPVFSPSEFIQMKGRGTRLHRFAWTNPKTRQVLSQSKTGFSLFDFFANYEFFEADYDYDEVKPVPVGGAGGGGGEPPPPPEGAVTDEGPDALHSTAWVTIGPDGMRVDREFWQTFEARVKADTDIVKAAGDDDWETVVSYIRDRLLGGPAEEAAEAHPAGSLDTLRFLLDQKGGASLEDLFARLFGRPIHLPTKEELLNQAWAQFSARHPVQPALAEDLKFFFKSYVGERRIRQLIDQGDLAALNHTALTLERLRKVPRWREVLAEIRAEVDLDRWGA